MKRVVVSFILTCMVVVATATVSAQTPTERPSSSDQQAERIDFERARQLLLKERRGEKLSAGEAAYLERAKAARRRASDAPGAAGRKPQRRLPGDGPHESTGFKPLTEMTAEDRYEGEDGGLYGNGRNEPPDVHRRAAEAELAPIHPLAADGQPANDGRVVFISISMSNATQEFSRFKRIADADPAKSAKLTIVDCAQGGQAMAEWTRPDAPPWSEALRRLERAGVSPQQVQVAWVKLANKSPSGSLVDHGKKLQSDTLAVVQNAKSQFPNLRIVYLSSRIYAGYATSGLNPEPYAYESAFVVRWLIQDQIKQNEALNFDPQRGAVKAPLLLWGPYLWADGTTPRAADKLIYTRDDLARDGTHPSESGRDKVARVMLDFYKTDPLAKPWFVGDAR